VGALMRKMHDAKTNGLEEVVIWGTGTPRREFIFVEDLGRACVFAMNNYEGIAPINLGSGHDVPIAQLAEMIKKVTGFQGRLVYDESKPDGMPVKLLDSSKLEGLGWRCESSLEDALRETYEWFVAAQR